MVMAWDFWQQASATHQLPASYSSARPRESPLIGLASSCGHRGREVFFFRPDFPVDVRHNAKIHRLGAGQVGRDGQEPRRHPRNEHPRHRRHRFLGPASRRAPVVGRPQRDRARPHAPAPDMRPRRAIRASLDDADAVRGACKGIESVFHVAAKVGVWGRYDDFFRTNVLGTRAVLGAAALRRATPHLHEHAERGLQRP